MTQIFWFYLFSAAAILSALYVVFTKRPTQGVLALVITMFSLSGLFVLLEAYFVAIIQILIYAGAILVLFLFMLMLMGVNTSEEGQKTASSFKRLTIYAVITAFFLEIWIVVHASANTELKSVSVLGTIESVGRTLFSQYLLQFELVSLVLLVGILGVISLTRKEV